MIRGTLIEHESGIPIADRIAFNARELVSQLYDTYAPSGREAGYNLYHMTDSEDGTRTVRFARRLGAALDLDPRVRVEIRSCAGTCEADKRPSARS